MKRMICAILAVLMLITVSVSIFADGYYPSPIKGDRVHWYEKEFETGDGQREKYIALFTDIETEKIMVYLKERELTVTPIDEKDKAVLNSIKKTLRIAERSVKKNEPFEQLREELDARASAIYEPLTADDLVVKELFDITLLRQYDEVKQPHGNMIYLEKDVTLTVFMWLKLQDKEVDPIVLVMDEETGLWHIMPAEYNVRNEDNTVDLTVDRVGAVLLLTVSDEALQEMGDVTSPRT